MKTVITACAVLLAAAAAGSQTAGHHLAYHGWDLGISLDSARELSSAQLGSGLSCVGAEDKTYFCQSDQRFGYASLYFSPTPRRLEEWYVQVPLNHRASRDSIAKAFTALWGATTRVTLPTRQSSALIATDMIGYWKRPGMVAGLVAINAVDTVRTLAVSVHSPARQIRLLREQTGKPSAR